MAVVFMEDAHGAYDLLTLVAEELDVLGLVLQALGVFQLYHLLFILRHYFLCQVLLAVEALRAQSLLEFLMLIGADKGVLLGVEPFLYTD